MEERLCVYIDALDTCSLEALLIQGANATVVNSNGRSAIGYATFKGLPAILRILLRSCDDDFLESCDNGNEPKKLKLDRDIDRTPDGMDGLQWEEEIQSSDIKSEDEWSKLYIYYARMIEKTGEMLNNTVKSKDPHCLDAFNHAPIHYAAMLGDVTSTLMLLDYSSPVDITTTMGFTPLHLAVKHAEIIRILLRRHANPNKKNFHNMESPLHTAARVGTPEVVSLLLNAGGCINATCMMERTPLFLAIASKNYEIANVLIDRGAKLNTQDSQSYTPLFVSVIARNVSLTERLLRLGARLFVPHYLLHYCVHNHMPEMIRVLVEFGDDNVVNIRDSSGLTPLVLAIQESNPDMVRLLIECGAELTPGRRAREMHIAVQVSNSVEMCKQTLNVLVRHGCGIDVLNDWGEAPVYLALLQDRFGITAHMIKEGACINFGVNTPDMLLLSRFHQNLNMVKLLVYAGILIKQRNDRPLPAPSDDPFDKFVKEAMTNPLSLQQLSRISIRGRLIDKQRAGKFRLSTNHNGSVMRYLVSLTGLPRQLQNYVYDFTDLPAMEGSDGEGQTIQTFPKYEPDAVTLPLM